MIQSNKTQFALQAVLCVTGNVADKSNKVLHGLCLDVCVWQSIQVSRSTLRQRRTQNSH